MGLIMIVEYEFEQNCWEHYSQSSIILWNIWLKLDLLFYPTD